MSQTVSDAIAATLHDRGVRFAFGIPGNDVLDLVRACEEHGIEFILARSEPAAAFMADAVFQLAGNPAALILAFGPGVANAGAGLASALMERTAMIVFAGELAANRFGIYNHQAFDHLAFATPITKLAQHLNPERAAQQTARAIDLAVSAPAGPVFINCPADATRSPRRDEPDFPAMTVSSANLPEEAAQRIRDKIAAARRPLALAGRGSIDGDVPAAVSAFLSSWGLPLLTTYKAKGVIDESHALSLGSVGLSPIVDAENLALVAEADLLVLIGFDPIELRDAWLDAWPADRPVLTIDSHVQTHRIFPVGEQAIGDMVAILAQLTRDEPSANPWPAERLAEFREKVAHIVRPRDPRGAISPAALFKLISDMATEDWVLTTDVGAHRILANHVIHCKMPGQFVQNNGLCCMGYAIPAAIGAQLAELDKTVVALLGDGCALMSLGELAIAAERDLPMVIVILNDSALSLIRLKQSKMQLERRAVDFGETRYDKIAEGFGMTGYHVDNLEAFTFALNEAVAAKRPALIDAVVDPTEYWEQM